MQTTSKNSLNHIKDYQFSQPLKRLVRFRYSISAARFLPPAVAWRLPHALGFGRRSIPSTAFVGAALWLCMIMIWWFDSDLIIYFHVMLQWPAKLSCWSVLAFVILLRKAVALQEHEILGPNFVKCQPAVNVSILAILAFWSQGPN